MVGLALAFPFLLMLLMVLMERIEVPLRREEIGSQLEAFLESARAEEVETYVSEGFAPALDRYWRRRRHLDDTGQGSDFASASERV
jgi:hypothetical protein